MRQKTVNAFPLKRMVHCLKFKPTILHPTLGYSWGKISGIATYAVRRTSWYTPPLYFLQILQIRPDPGLTLCSMLYTRKSFTWMLWYRWSMVMKGDVAGENIVKHSKAGHSRASGHAASSTSTNVVITSPDKTVKCTRSSQSPEHLPVTSKPLGWVRNTFCTMKGTITAQPQHVLRTSKIDRNSWLSCHSETFARRHDHLISCAWPPFSPV